MTQDNHIRTDANTRNHHILEFQKFSPFSAGDHKAAQNKQVSMTDKHETQSTKNPQKKRRIGMVSKLITRVIEHV